MEFIEEKITVRFVWLICFESTICMYVRGGHLPPGLRMDGKGGEDDDDECMQNHKKMAFRKIESVDRMHE